MADTAPSADCLIMEAEGVDLEPLTMSHSEKMKGRKESLSQRKAGEGEEEERKNESLVHR